MERGTTSRGSPAISAPTATTNPPNQFRSPSCHPERSNAKRCVVEGQRLSLRAAVAAATTTATSTTTAAAGIWSASAAWSTGTTTTARAATLRRFIAGTRRPTWPALRRRARARRARLKRTRYRRHVATVFELSGRFEPAEQQMIVEHSALIAERIENRADARVRIAGKIAERTRDA